MFLATFCSVVAVVFFFKFCVDSLGHKEFIFHIPSDSIRFTRVIINAYLYFVMGTLLCSSVFFFPINYRNLKVAHDGFEPETFGFEH